MVIICGFTVRFFLHFIFAFHLNLKKARAPTEPLEEVQNGFQNALSLATVWFWLGRMTHFFKNWFTTQKHTDLEEQVEKANRTIAHQQQQIQSLHDALEKVMGKLDQQIQASKNANGECNVKCTFSGPQILV